MGLLGLMVTAKGMFGTWVWVCVGIGCNRMEEVGVSCNG